MKTAIRVGSARGGQVTMQDVADEVGISKMAVSHVLNGRNKVSSKTREAVLEAVSRLGFEPNVHAQRLAQGGVSDTVGLIALWFDFGVAAQKIHLIQNALNEQGFDVPLYGVGLRDRYDESVQVAAIAKARAQQPRALVCATSGLRPRALDELQRYQDQGGILVCYDYATEMSCDHVLFDREDNTYQAARHLLELGHRDLGIAFHGVSKNSQERLSGFHRAVREFGAQTRPTWIFEGQNNSNYAEGGLQIAARYLGLAKRPSALCIVNDYAALSFLAAVQRAGVECPANISVVGHDDHTLSRYYPVPLTTVSHPAETIASHVTQFLLSRINGEYSGPPRQVTVKGELLIRQSTVRLSSRPPSKVENPQI